jgi:hypothetical protein
MVVVQSAATVVITTATFDVCSTRELLHFNIASEANATGMLASRVVGGAENTSWGRGARGTWLIIDRLMGGVYFRGV